VLKSTPCFDGAMPICCTAVHHAVAGNAVEHAAAQAGDQSPAHAPQLLHAGQGAVRMRDFLHGHVCACIAQVHVHNFQLQVEDELSVWYASR